MKLDIKILKHENFNSNAVYLGIRLLRCDFFCFAIRVAIPFYNLLKKWHDGRIGRAIFRHKREGKPEPKKGAASGDDSR